MTAGGPSDGRYVAWIDVLGVSELYHKDRGAAVDLWERFRCTVADLIGSPTADFKVYGVNDGCFIHAQVLCSLLDLLLHLYQRWFDNEVQQATRLRPLLRGGITSSVADRAPACDKIPVWLLGPGFLHAQEFESKLRGGRLFLDPALDCGLLKPSDMRYDWYDLTESGKVPASENDRNQVELIEWLWPLTCDEEVFLQRLNAAKELYAEHLDKNPTPPKNIELSPEEKALLHCEETLKTCIRAAGTLLGHSRSKKLIEALQELQEYRKEEVFFTWGVSFVALEAIYRSGIEERERYIQKSVKFVSDNACGKYRADFVSQLSKRTYEDFGEWVKGHSDIQ